MENKMVNIATGEVMNPTPPEVLDDAALSALIAQSMNSKMTLFQSTGIEAGVVDTPLKAFTQLKTEEVLMMPLHVNCVHVSRAAADEKQIEGVDSTDYPVMTFNELPGRYYSGGKRFMQIIMAWAKACGDKFELKELGEKGSVFTGDRLLPELNKYIAAGNYPCVVMKLKDGKKNKYTDVFVLSI